MSSTTKASKTDVEEQLDALREDVAALTKTVSELARRETKDGRQIMDRTMETVSTAVSEQGRRLMELAGDSARGAEREAIGYVRRKPLQSMAVALAAGAVVGWLTRER